MMGVVQVSGDFKEIRALDDVKYKNIDTISNRPSFYIFNHRGRLMQWVSNLVNQDPFFWIAFLVSKLSRVFIVNKNLILYIN